MAALATILSSGCASQPAFSASDATRQAAIVRQATNLLTTHYVHPLDSAVLLSSGWSGLETAAIGNGAVPPGPAPRLGRAPEAAQAAFDAAFTAYLTGDSRWPASAEPPAYAVVRAMANSVHEGHTCFLDPHDRQTFLETGRAEQVYGGVGLGFVGPGLVVSEVIENAPAARAGIGLGDQILEIEGREVAGERTSDAARWLRGPVGSRVDIVVRPRGESTIRNVVMERTSVAVPAVTAHVLTGQVGYLSIRGFSDDAIAGQVDEALAGLEHDGVRGLVVDLRSNPGGRLDTGVRVLGDFLPPGSQAFQETDRFGARHPRQTRSGGHPFHGPIAVLINRQTGSTAELVSSALHEYGLATLVGSTTAGNVAGGQLFGLDDGSALDVTTLELRSAHNAVLNGHGVEPDVWIEGSPASDPDGVDRVLQRATLLVAASLPTEPR